MFWHRIYILCVLALVGLITIIAPQKSAARVSIYPQTLYGGMNVITVRSTNGLSRVQWSNGGDWSNLRTGINTRLYRVVAGAVFSNCATEATFTIFVKAIDREFNVPIRVVDCDNDDDVFNLRLSSPWRVYLEQSEVELGKTGCHQFTVDPSVAGSLVIDSITSPSPYFTIRYTERRPPLRIHDVYHYDVCYSGKQLGEMRRPILVYIRREQPAGGYTNFIVADTAYLVVVPPETPVSPPARTTPPRPSRPPLGHVITPPAIIIEPVPEPPRIPDIDTVSNLPTPSAQIGSYSEPPVVPSLADEDPKPIPEFVIDPTTFRVLLMPTAKSLGSGSVFLANYDVAGWVFGYGASDRLSLLGGFLFIPGVLNYNLLVSGGAKYEFLRDGYLRMAAGAQFSFSQTERSSITLGSPYAVASIGNEDQRGSLLLGYSLRHHNPVDGESFDRQAAILGIGGDYRIGFHWKVVGELVLLENSDVQPLSLTARYFANDFSIDAGVLVNIDPAGGGFRVAPVINGIWVW